jgi:hypothetical protein
MNEWIELMSFSNNVEAEIAKATLENLGIKSRIEVQVLGEVRLPGMLTMVGLWVPKENFDEAKRALNNFGR